MTERLRAAAVDTGAIEGLYSTDRGFTLLVAQETISLDQAEVEKGAEFRRNFEAQLEGFQLSLDVATSATPISEALIRRLHEVTCAGQPVHRVITSHGVQERQLVLGSYKTEPNHVQLGDGSFHAYAPVEEVPHEMRRLVEQLRSPEFESAHPVVQAAYAHHALTSIHPFADGNGRVARLLASIWLLRAASIPLWVEPTDRDRYLDALESADNGSGGRFVDLVKATSLTVLRELSLVVRRGERKRAVGSQEATRAAVDEANRALRTVLDRELPGKLGWWPPQQASRLPFPGGIEFDLKEGITAITLRNGGGRWISFGVDWSSSADGRFRLYSCSTSASDVLLPVMDEPFAEHEIIAVPGSSAVRRIEALVQLIIEET